MVLQAEHPEKPDMQGTFHTCICFLMIMFINASCVIGLSLEVEAFGKAIVWENSSLGSRVRVGQIGRDYELKILVILLMVDLRVVDVSGVDIILDMDELTAIGLLVIVTLGGLSYLTRSWGCVRLHMHVSDAYVREISGRNYFKGGRM